MAKIEVSSLQGWIPLNINAIRVLTTSGRKPPLLPNTQDLHAEKDAEDGLCQGQVGLRTHRSRRPHLCPASSRCAVPDRIARQARRTDEATAQGLAIPHASPDRRPSAGPGPDKTIYAVGDEFQQYYTPIAEPNSQLPRAHGVRQLPEHLCWLRLRQYLQLHSVGEHEGSRYLGNLRTESAWSGNIYVDSASFFILTSIRSTAKTA